MKSVIVIEKKGAAEILKDYKGHTLKNVIVHDGSHTEQMTREILLEFEDAPATSQPLEADWAKIAIQKENNKARMRQQVLCWLFGPESDGADKP